MSYKADFSDEFLKIAKKLKKKDYTTFKRLQSKIEEILINPVHYKPLKSEMKGLRRAHLGSFVIIFKIDGDYVTLQSLLIILGMWRASSSESCLLELVPRRLQPIP